MLCVRHCEGSDVAIKVFVHFISSNPYSHTIRMIYIIWGILQVRNMRFRKQK